jgi:hypothetical protein
MGGAGGQTSGHQGFVVELEDGAAAAEALRRWQNPTTLEGLLGIAAVCGKEEVSGGLEHSAAWTVSHQRGRGDSGVETVGSARTGPVGA